jgi:hypothetical protein
MRPTRERITARPMPKNAPRANCGRSMPVPVWMCGAIHPRSVVREHLEEVSYSGGVPPPAG